MTPASGLGFAGSLRTLVSRRKLINRGASTSRVRALESQKARGRQREGQPVSCWLAGRSGGAWWCFPLRSEPRNHRREKGPVPGGSAPAAQSGPFGKARWSWYDNLTPRPSWQIEEGALLCRNIPWHGHAAHATGAIENPPGNRCFRPSKAACRISRSARGGN